MFLPKEAIIIELFQGDTPKHYRNFAKWSGVSVLFLQPPFISLTLSVYNLDKRYMAFSSGPSVNVDAFLGALEGAVRLTRSFNEQHSSCGLSC